MINPSKPQMILGCLSKLKFCLKVLILSKSDENHVIFDIHSIMKFIKVRDFTTAQNNTNVLIRSLIIKATFVIKTYA